MKMKYATLAAASAALVGAMPAEGAVVTRSVVFAASDFRPTANPLGSGSPLAQVFISANFTFESSRSANNLTTFTINSFSATNYLGQQVGLLAPSFSYNADQDRIYFGSAVGAAGCSISRGDWCAVIENLIDNHEYTDEEIFSGIRSKAWRVETVDEGDPYVLFGKNLPKLQRRLLLNQSADA